MITYTHTLPIGPIQISLTDQKLTDISFSKTKAELAPSNHPIIKELNAYFQNPQHIFNIPFQIKGTPFQQRVWQALQEIPSGQVVTYSDLAKKLNTGPRAIGNACRTNPLPIVIPCHRVVAKNHLGGYTGNITGPFLEIKKWLLAHEKTA